MVRKCYKKKFQPDQKKSPKKITKPLLFKYSTGKRSDNFIESISLDNDIYKSHYKCYEEPTDDVLICARTCARTLRACARACT